MANFLVLIDGETFTPGQVVLDCEGAEHTVSTLVLDCDGNSVSVLLVPVRNALKPRKGTITDETVKAVLN